MSSGYSVKISKTEIDSYLPYFGRAYVAPVGQTEGGIKFISKKFDYASKAGKKGGWDIQIKPGDASGIQELTLSVSEDGYATLMVISTNRQPISFYGIISEVKQSENK